MEKRCENCKFYIWKYDMSICTLPNCVEPTTRNSTCDDFEEK